MCQAIEKFCTEALSKLLQPLWKIVFMRPGYAHLPKSTGKLRSISIHRWMDFSSCLLSYTFCLYTMMYLPSFLWLIAWRSHACQCVVVAFFAKPRNVHCIHGTWKFPRDPKKTKQQGPKRKNTMFVALSLELCRWCRRCRIEFLQPQGAHFQIAGKCCWSDSFPSKWIVQMNLCKMADHCPKSMQQTHKLHG